MPSGEYMDFFALAEQCAPAVHPQTMAAIVKTESGFNPFAIGVNKGGAQLPRQPKDKAEAVAAAKALIEGGKNIDMGLGQINSANLVRLQMTVEDVFDSCKNLGAAALILTDNFVRASAKTDAPEAALHKALSAYNTGSFSRGIQNGYVQRVSSNGQKIAQGYTVPAITNAALAPKTATDPKQAQQSAPVVLRSIPPAAQTKAAATAALDPTMVYADLPQMQATEAKSVMVY